VLHDFTVAVVVAVLVTVLVLVAIVELVVLVEHKTVYQLVVLEFVAAVAVVLQTHKFGEAVVMVAVVQVK
jgi:hypothetical protein